MTKVCTKCGRELPATTEFFRKCTGGNWLFSKCRECTREEGRIWGQENKEHIKAYLQQNAERLKECRKEYYRKNVELINERRKEYNEEYRKKNAELIKEKKKIYRQNHLESSKKYWEENKERFKEKYRLYYLENGEKIKERTRIYRKNNHDKRNEAERAWRLRNPGEANIRAHRRSAKIRELPRNYSIEEWKILTRHFDNKCAYCGEEKPLQQDHFVPVVKGGEYTINNIIPACKSCNCSKNDRDFFEWYPRQKFYSKKREQKILKYLNYTKAGTQQLALTM